MHDYVNGQRELCQMALHGCPHSAPYPIALYCASQNLTNRESYAGTPVVIPMAVENHHVPQKVFSAFLVYNLKVCVFQQS